MIRTCTRQPRSAGPVPEPLCSLAEGCHICGAARPGISGRSAPPAGAAGNRPGACSREGRKEGGGERTALFLQVPLPTGPGSRHRVVEQAGTAAKSGQAPQAPPSLGRSFLGSQITACGAGQEEGAFFFFLYFF